MVDGQGSTASAAGTDSSMDVLNSAMDAGFGNSEGVVTAEVSGQPEVQPSNSPEQLTPPNDWSADEKEYFSNLDAKGQKFWLDKWGNWNKGFSSKFQEQAEEVKFAKAVKEKFDKYKDYMQMIGVDPVQKIENDFIIQQEYNNNPKQFIRQLMQMKGLSPQEFMEQVEAGAQQTNNGDKYLSELNALKNEVARIKSLPTQNKVMEFKNAKDSQGNLKYPHFEKLAPSMAKLVNSDDDSLEMLYNKALRLDDELYAAEIAKIKAEALSAGDVKKAQAASFSLKNSKNAKVGGEGKKGLDELVSQHIT